ncbi:MAG: arsenic efflux protein [Candidatus Altiarchaeota archaeon]|nr:arsenic efflux protein [Candidatus Altiarchaeota archaeon]
MIQEILLETSKIIFLVTVMMILVEWIQVNYKEKIRGLLTSNIKNQIIGSSLLGMIPGCIDAFFIVSLYTHGLVGFGALTAVMLSTAGDEAFIMLTMLPLETTLKIFFLCFVFGILGGFLAEWTAKKLGLKRSTTCVIEVHADESRMNRHFLKEHIFKHIILKHIPKLALWILLTLLAVDLLTENFDLEGILPPNMLFVLILAAIVGIIPESGPHLIFLTLFVNGTIPLSVFLTNTLVQDGHGLLPLLSCSLKDTINVKLFNAAFGLLIGLIFFSAGL